MKLIFQDEEPTTCEERAGQWCVRLATGSLSSEQQAEFDAWLSADPANVSAFDQALIVWDGLHAIADAPEIISRRADSLDAMRRANRGRWSHQLSGRWWGALAIAASLALLVVSSLWLMGSRPQEYATGLGERRALLLADGSRLSLDAETRVAVLYESDHRKLTLLAGRAKFDVAKDSKRPFTVTAGNRTVIATGTAFSVELLGKQVHVIVYEGRVAVVNGAPPAPARLLAIKRHPGEDAMALTPGKEMVADLFLATQPLVTRTDISRSLGWEGGQLNFVDEPLTTAVEQLNRYSASKILIGDPRTGNIAINGVFNAGDSGAFIEAISRAYAVGVSQDGGDTVLTAAGG